MSSEGSCIVCGGRTTNRVRVEGRPGVGRPYSHWRCPLKELDQCADRRDAKRKRPRHADPNLLRALDAIAVTPREAVADHVE